MRTRKEIEDSFVFPNAVPHKLIHELLLDIRELLMEKEKPKKDSLYKDNVPSEEETANTKTGVKDEKQK